MAFKGYFHLKHPMTELTINWSSFDKVESQPLVFLATLIFLLPHLSLYNLLYTQQPQGSFKKLNQLYYSLSYRALSDFFIPF